MKNIRKQMTAMILASTLALNMCPAAFAAESTQQPQLFAYSLNADDVPSPRMKYIDVISAGIMKKSLGRAVCTGTVMMDPAYDCEFEMVLQRSKDGETWSDEKTWTATNPDRNGEINVLEKSYYMTLGNYYRLSNTVKVYSKSGKWLETAGKYSNIVKY